MDTNTGDLILKYGEIVETSYILIPQTEPPQFLGEGALIKPINFHTIGFNSLVAQRVILLVVFGFLSQNFGTWWGLTNGTLSFYECRLGGGDTQTLPDVIGFVLNFLHSLAVEMLKHSLASEPPRETFTIFRCCDVLLLYIEKP